MLRHFGKIILLLASTNTIDDDADLCGILVARKIEHHKDSDCNVVLLMPLTNVAFATAKRDAVRIWDSLPQSQTLVRLSRSVYFNSILGCTLLLQFVDTVTRLAYTCSWPISL